MHRFLFVLALLFSTAVAQAAPSDVFGTVSQFIADFNKGDVSAAVALCNSPSSIIDEFAPYHWHGATACKDWANALNSANAKDGITGGRVTLGKPSVAEATGDAGYVIVPTSYSYKMHGKPVTESGAMMTVALKKGGSGWRITAWSWSRGHT